MVVGSKPKLVWGDDRPPITQSFAGIFVGYLLGQVTLPAKSIPHRSKARDSPLDSKQGANTRAYKGVPFGGF